MYEVPLYYFYSLFTYQQTKGRISYTHSKNFHH